MSIFDWLKKRSRQVDADDVRRVVEVVKSSFDELTSPSPAPPRSRPPVSSRSTPRPASRPPIVRTVPDNARWIAPNEEIQVQGYDIPGGMLYLGTRLMAPKETPEPALIDPDLRIDRNRPDTEGRYLDYWPAYAEIPPTSRAAYLAWLANGRRTLATPIGYVFLFLYGLERRVLVDIAANPQLAIDLPMIRAEVAALLELYGPLSSSFRGYAGDFLGLIDLMTVDDPQRAPLVPPPLHGPREPTPTSLRIALGRYAAAGQPIPPEWALAWAWYHPEISPRTPATRCPDEFGRLFQLRYRERHGDGLIVKPGKRRVLIRYRPASAGIDVGTLNSATTPDVFPLLSPGRKLGELFTSVTDELDPYSRWLGRNPEKAGSIAALALLPSELAIGVSGQVRELTTWADGLLGTNGVATISGSDLMRFWPLVSPEKLSRAEGVALAQALARLDLGIEPDLRFGGPPIARESLVVLFRMSEHPPETASAAYATATMLVYLAAIVGSADRNASEREIDQLRGHLDGSLNLTLAERRRLDAHLAWLAATDLKLTGLRLKKRIDALTATEREAIGSILTSVAASDGVISPAEVTTLMKIYKLLGLDPEAVTSRLHATLTSTSPRPARGPVTVRPAGTPDPGFPLPPRPGQTGEPANDSAPTNGFVLDPEAIRRKMADTAVVSALLGSIFTEDYGTNVLQWKDETPQKVTGQTAADAPTDAPAGDLIGGLDASHSGLLRQLATRESWDAEAFEALASSFQLMPNGALDVLNEAAYEIAGEPVIEGDDPLVINRVAMNSMIPLT